MTLRRSLLGGVILVILIPSLAALWLLKNVERELEESVGQHTVTLAANLGNTIDRAVFHRIQTLRDFVQTSRELQDRLRESNLAFSQLGDRATITAEIQRRDQEWIEAGEEELPAVIAQVLEDPVSSLLQVKLEYYRSSYRYLVYGEIFITNRYGATVAETSRTSDYRQDDEQWWQDAMRHGVAVSDPVYDTSAKLNALDISLRIDGSEGEPVGVLKAVLNIAEVERLLAEFIAESGYREIAVELLDARGKVLLRSSQGLGEGTRAGTPRAAGGGGGSGSEPTERVGFERIRTAAGDKILRATAVTSGYREFSGNGWALQLDLAAEEALAAVSELRRGLAAVGTGGLALAILLGVTITTALVRRLAVAVKAADRMAAGELEFDVGRSGITEVAALLASMDLMVTNVRRAVRAMLTSSKQGGATAGRLVGVSREIFSGAHQLAATSEQASTSMEEMASSIDQVAAHSERVAVAIEDASASIEEMAASIRSVASSSEELSGAVGQTLSTMEGNVASLRTLADQGTRARQEAGHVIARTAAGREAVQQATSAVEQISTSMADIVESVQRLGDESRQIHQIAETLDSISAQTHLLALNASIQAAHAGEHGKGFGVVAREVSALAEQSSSATGQITGILSKLEEDVRAVIEVTRAGSESARRGVELALAADADLEDIRRTTEAFISTVARVSHTLEVQAGSAEKVVATFERMRSLTQLVLEANRDQAGGSERILHAFGLINSMAAEVSEAMQEQSRAGEEILLAMRRLAEASAASHRSADAIVEISEAVRDHAAALARASAFFTGSQEEPASAQTAPEPPEAPEPPQSAGKPSAREGGSGEGDSGEGARG